MGSRHSYPQSSGGETFFSSVPPALRTLSCTLRLPLYDRRPLSLLNHSDSIPQAALGYSHPVLKCPVGAPVHIIRKLAFEMFQTHIPEERNPRIIDAGFSVHRDEDLPPAHRKIFAETREVCKALARKLAYESGVCPDFGTLVARLGPPPLRDAGFATMVREPARECAVRALNRGAQVEALVNLGRRFAVDNRDISRDQKLAVVSRLAKGGTANRVR